MQVVKSQVLEGVKVTFVEDDVVCPICESYGVEEYGERFECYQCGTRWKVQGLER